jgi:hypothetical protein
MAKKKNTRPALVQPCENVQDHAKHHWVPAYATEWPEGAFWHCPGYNRAEAALGARETARAIRRVRKAS